MNDGNSAVADPTQANGSPTPDGAAPQPSLDQVNAELREKLARTEEQLSGSSREAHRLVDELKSLKAAQEKPNKVQGFPSREQYVKHWTEHDKTEKEASAEYEREKAYYDNQMVLAAENQALRNQIGFFESQLNSGLESANPQAKEAIEFFKDIPELDALPVSQKIARLNTIRAKSPKVEGRDTSALKASAGGPVGGNGARAIEGADASLDKIARERGHPSWKALQEKNLCTTQAEMDAWNRKYKSK